MHRKRLSEARCGFSEKLTGSPPTKEKEAVDSKRRDTSIGALSVESEADLFKGQIDDALRLALRVASMDLASAPTAVKNARSGSTTESHLQRIIGQFSERWVSRRERSPEEPGGLSTLIMFLTKVREGGSSTEFYPG